MGVKGVRGTYPQWDFRKDGTGARRFANGAPRRAGGDGSLEPVPGRPDLVLFGAAVALAVLGLMMVFSASYSTGMQNYQDPYFFIKRQLAHATIGALVMMITMRIDYRIWRPLALPGLLVAFALLVLVLLIGVEVNGAKAWINLGITNFQPAEFTKLALINFTAAYIAYRRGGMRRFWTGLVPPLAVLALAFGLIMLQPDFGTGVVLLSAIVLMLFAGGANVGHIAAMGLCGLPVLGYMIYQRPYRLRRIVSFLDPWKDPLDSGWNIIQSLLAIGSGGLFGLGLGEGRQKFAYLPEQHTDFIFSVLGEELGFVGTATVLFLFFVIAWRGYRAALTAPDLFGSMLAVGLTSVICFQAILNIGVATGSLPVTGVTLPFLSFGGTSLVATFAAVGVLLNISRAGRSVKGP